MNTLDLYGKLNDFDRDIKHVITVSHIKGQMTVRAELDATTRRHELDIEHAFISRLLRAYAGGCNSVQDLLNAYLQELKADNLTQIEVKEIFEQSRETQKELQRTFQEQMNASAQTSASC